MNSIAIIVIFIINPLVGIILNYLLINYGKTNSDKDIKYRTIFICSLFIGIVNSSKVIFEDPDLTWYVNGYLEIPYKSFFNYIFEFGINGKGRELAFPFINYILYFIIGNNERMYIVLVTLISYYLLNLSLYYYCTKMNISKRLMLFGIYFMTLFPMIFTTSATILRQTLSGAMLQMLIISVLFMEKKRIWLAVTMFLTHVTTLFFIPLIYIRQSATKVNIKTGLYLFILIVFLFIYQNIAEVFSSYFSTSNAIGYALNRAAVDTKFELRELGIFKIIFNSFFTILFYVSIVRNKTYKNVKNRLHYANIIVVLVLFIIVNINQTELSVRFNFYFWQFFPFLIITILNTIKNITLILPLLFVLLVTYFIYYLNTSIWTYEIAPKIFIYSILMELF